ncbi:MAG: DUF4262 domain-containing protein [Terricaulis sp.]|nr:DUF4262 domain-containing protein [Terricaulis sp.]
MTDDEYERDILSNVKEHGWFCSSVFDPKGKSPSFSYSVGFTQTLQAPEFIVFGLDTKLMHAMLWQVFRALKAGRVPADMQRWAGLLEGHECILRAVHPTNVVRDYLNSAMWFWGDPDERGPLQAFQIFWPAVGGNLFPWDSSCPQVVRDSQPALYLPNTALH